jgi:hypothetical protein
MSSNQKHIFNAIAPSDEKKWVFRYLASLETEIYPWGFTKNEFTK